MSDGKRHYPKGTVVSRIAGPGTELKKLLATLGLTATGGCRCDQHAAQMDAWGPDGCRARLGEIVGWLRAEAARLGVCGPGFDDVAAVAVQMAIDRARAAAAAAGDE